MFWWVIWWHDGQSKRPLRQDKHGHYFLISHLLFVLQYFYHNFESCCWTIYTNRKIILHDVFVQLQSIFNSTNINHGQSYPIFGFWLKYYLIFIRFINDIVNSSKILDFSTYADDNCLIIGVDKKKLDDTIKSEPHKGLECFHCNQLLINVDKTGYLFFAPIHIKITWRENMILLIFIRWLHSLLWYRGSWRPRSPYSE